MKINEQNLDINKLTSDIYDDKSMIKMRGNGIYLSDNQIEVLKRYDIDYKKYSSLNSLIFEIEEILNYETNARDLEEISLRLSELNYYKKHKWK